MSEEFIEQSANTGEVAETQQVETVQQETAGQETSVNTSEVANPNPVQDTETNAHFADMRRQQEALQQQLEQSNQQAAYLDRLAGVYGYANTQDFIQAVEQAEQQRQIQEQAQKMNIDEQTYQQYFQPVNQRLQQYESEINQLRTERVTTQIERQVNELESKYPDFKQYASKAFDLAIQRGYDLEHAYILSSHQDRTTQAEQAAIKSLQQNAATTPGALGESAPNPTTSISKMSKDQFADLQRRVKNGESINL